MAKPAARQLTQALGLEEEGLVHGALATPVEEVGGVVTGEEGAGRGVGSPVDHSPRDGLPSHTRIIQRQGSNRSGCSELAHAEDPEARPEWWYLAVAALDLHLVLQQPRQLAEQDAVVQPVHQAVSRQVRA